MSVRLALALLASLAVTAVTLAAQTPPDSLRSTMVGVYADEQAAKGKDVYLGQCQSCHTAADFTSADFRSRWVGKLLSEFFTYLVENMPESEPGALSREQYAQVTAYVLQLNRVPAGALPLPSELDSLKSIKLELPDSAGVGAGARASVPGAARRAMRR